MLCYQSPPPPPKSSFTASYSDLTSTTAAVSAQKQLRFSLHKREVAKLGVKLGLRSTRAASHGPFSRVESQTQVPGTGSEASGNHNQCKQSTSSVTAPPDSTLATAPAPRKPTYLARVLFTGLPTTVVLSKASVTGLVRVAYIERACLWLTPSSSCPPLVEGGNPAMFLPGPTYSSGCGES